MKNAINLNNSIKEEADFILDKKGLIKMLSSLAKSENIFLSGSYILDVMAWRDLDIFIDIKNLELNALYVVVYKIMKSFKPQWIEMRETFKDNSGCPKGYFIGFESRIKKNKLWNIDVWITDRKHIEQNQIKIRDILKKLDNSKRDFIIRLKKDLIKNKKYGKSITSIDLYKAVLENNINTIKDFYKWKTERIID